MKKILHRIVVIETITPTINNIIAHNAIGVAYYLAVLKEPRPEINADIRSDLSLLLQAYPEKREYIMGTIKRKLKRKLEKRDINLYEL